MTHLALDPNVLLAAALARRQSEELLDSILEMADVIQLAVDEGSQLIRKAYEKVLEDPNLGHKLERVSEAIDRGTLTFKPLPAHKAATRKEWLNLNGFGAPVEPELLALAAENARRVHLVVCGNDYSHPLWGQRGTHDGARCASLSSEPDFKDVTVHKDWQAYRRLLAWTKDDPIYPGTHRELEDFLAQKKYVESDDLEFKSLCKRFGNKCKLSLIDTHEGAELSEWQGI